MAELTVSKRKKERILEVSEELFAEFGYDRTSVRMIAQKANINIAMISYYFGSKELLFTELVEYRALSFRLRLQDIQKEIEDPMKQIEMMIDGYVDKVFVNHRFHKILHRQISLQNSSELNVQIQSILMKNINEVKNIIESGIKKKVFRQVDVEFLIITFFGTVSQFSNSSGLSLSLLNLDQGMHLTQIPEMKSRMKKYLTELFAKYLLITNN
ncbi:MAG TPA: TetR family transcriptional regulator [Bacteroidia bacterium]|jgi:AcrR family transcriptional regulator|nr:TetR/AcrR family transcriptional regulator [Bacteroidota bacterium]MBP9789343.1 TetR/AcrR family transcriptional regulator [Bacteroidia bacterium]MBK7431764.1 TetR/AcrR family transcriptional regulator [Bacteroidota bacterium]MBK7570856.1 TetR/AcrR family transcriptional regulator [Bacteroidota bacterium]MBK8586339.1 TetR/AcrR family transcriptional regulator [Bacteroidota bacterium]